MKTKINREDGEADEKLFQIIHHLNKYQVRAVLGCILISFHRLGNNDAYNFVAAQLFFEATSDRT